jgi:DNA-directed RNA polymerase specialized sigma24 family protein
VSAEKDRDVDNVPLAKRLDAIIRLLMEQQVADGKLQKQDQVLILDAVGLSSGDIGHILGQKSKDVSSWLKRLKTQSRRPTKVPRQSP